MPDDFELEVAAVFPNKVSGDSVRFAFTVPVTKDYTGLSLSRI